MFLPGTAFPVCGTEPDRDDAAEKTPDALTGKTDGAAAADGDRGGQRR